MKQNLNLIIHSIYCQSQQMKSTLKLSNNLMWHWTIVDPEWGAHGMVPLMTGNLRSSFQTLQKSKFICGACEDILHNNKYFANKITSTAIFLYFFIIIIKC